MLKLTKSPPPPGSGTAGRDKLQQKLSEQNSNTEAFNEAIAAVSNRGWSVIPVCADSKHPDTALLPGGKWGPYQKRIPTNDELTAWKVAEAFAVVTGSLSGVVVLDVDPGGKEQLDGRHLPVTPIASTPRGGWHYYFQHPGERIKSFTHILGPGSAVDLRGDGGYVVLPGVVGRKWIIHPEEVPLAPMPEWLLELGRAETKTNKTPVIKNNHSNLYVTGVKSVVPFPGNTLDGDQLQAYANRADVGLEVAKLLGLPVDSLIEKGCSKNFCCILPGHSEEDPSASLYRHPQTGAILYRDWHGKDRAQWYPLVSVAASLAYGKTIQLRGPELATWQIRLLVEVGILKPVPVQMKPLPAGATDVERKVYDGFRFLLGCKWRYSPNEPTPFARNFAAAWCGVSVAQVRSAIEVLQMKYQVIRIVERYGYYRLWLPAPLDEGHYDQPEPDTRNRASAKELVR